MPPNQPTATPPVSRVTRSRRQARAAYDRLSRWYDTLAAPSEAPARAAGVRLLAAQPGERVLEIGAGTGHALLALAQAGARPVGIDLSPGMLRVARRRLSAGGAAAALLCGDGARLPVADGAFDAVFMAFTLELFDTPELPVVLADCRRVLRPGGRLVVVSLHSGPGRLVRLYEWAHRRWPVTVDCRPIPLAQCLEASDFRVVTSERRTLWGLPVAVCAAFKE